MSSLEFEGKNVDNAVKRACDELNIALEDMNYEVLSRGSSGIFGLARAKKARIRVTLSEKTSAVLRDNDPESTDDPVLEAQIPTGTPLADDGGSSEPQQADVPEGNPLDLAQAVLQHIIDAITSDASIAVEKTNGRILLNVAGGNAGALIGKKGQTLEAIQSLIDKIVNKHSDRHDRIRIQVDIEGYLATRQLNLEKLALRLADKSKKIRKPISLGQMNGYDRRIVHLVLKDDPEVQTKSRGEGYRRKLVIFPKKNSASGQSAH